MPLRFSNKQSRRGSGSRDSESGAASVFEKVIMLGPVLPQNTEVDTHRDFPVVKQWFCSFTLVEIFDKVICEIFDRLPVISGKLSVHVTGADEAEKEGASSISEIGHRGL
ncbi:hypothetical protein ACFX2C_034773 [Malus domestica]